MEEDDTTEVTEGGFECDRIDLGELEKLKLKYDADSEVIFNETWDLTEDGKAKRR